ncbi:hypothetical protein DAPPUDRAFT_122839, partial [Daphnia pulex]
SRARTSNSGHVGYTDSLDDLSLYVSPRTPNSPGRTAGVTPLQLAIDVVAAARDVDSAARPRSVAISGPTSPISASSVWTRADEVKSDGVAPSLRAAIGDAPLHLHDVAGQSFRVVVKAAARVNVSAVSLSTHVVSFGVASVGVLKTAFVELRNERAHRAVMQLSYRSKVVRITSVENVNIDAPFVVPARSVHRLRIEYLPRKANREYVREVRLFNLCNPANELAFEVRSTNVDNSRLPLHSLFYYVHPLPGSRSVFDHMPGVQALAADARSGSAFARTPTANQHGEHEFGSSIAAPGEAAMGGNVLDNDEEKIDIEDDNNDDGEDDDNEEEENEEDDDEDDEDEDNDDDVDGESVVDRAEGNDEAAAAAASTTAAAATGSHFAASASSAPFSFPSAASVASGARSMRHQLPELPPSTAAAQASSARASLVRARAAFEGIVLDSELQEFPVSFNDVATEQSFVRAWTKQQHTLLRGLAQRHRSLEEVEVIELGAHEVDTVFIVFTPRISAGSSFGSTTTGVHASSSPRTELDVTMHDSLCKLHKFETTIR